MIDYHYIAQPSRKLGADDAAVIKLLLSLGFPQHRIASLFDVNQGRISEIASGEKFSDVEPLA